MIPANATKRNANIPTPKSSPHHSVRITSFKNAITAGLTLTGFQSRECQHDESPFRKNEKNYASQTRDVHSHNP